MSQLGSEALPLRVAIIGSGPSGFYAAEPLLKQEGLVVQIDMFDRLPTPHGLVRGGVAPDHPKIKSVSKVYDKTAAHPNFRFFGNVHFGKDITHAELKAHYHAIIYAVGAQSDRRLDVPGEELTGSYAATEFVGWYNAHPDYRDCSFDLAQENAVVVGNGNVAMDVTRILASSYDELHQTDIADYALEVLRDSKVKNIYMLGRRGPVQAAFTNPELKELGELKDADVIVDPTDLILDALSQQALETSPNATAEKNLKTLAEFSAKPPSGKSKRIYLRFLVSPIELLGEQGHVRQMKLVKNSLEVSADASLKAVPTSQVETIPAGLVFRSIGYMGIQLPGVPFDQRRGIIPNDHGRLIDPDTKVTILGEYVVGWIKRGPSGVIGTNKPDSLETVNNLIADIELFPVLDSVKTSPDAIEQLIRERQPRYVSYGDWLLLDQYEQEQGQTKQRPRLKFSRVEDMLDKISQLRK